MEQVLDQFETMKQLSKKINLAIGTVTLWCIFEACVLCNNIGDILTNRIGCPLPKYFLCRRILLDCLFAADITRQVSGIYLNI